MDILTLAIAKSKSGSPNGTITTENITNALGYKPADQEEVSKLSEEIDTLNKGGLNLKEDFIGEQVNEWLDEHPDATTTVQDHSLTIDKMVVGTLGYVTPEMFGAVGDGLTDDTVSFQNALNYCVEKNVTLKSCGKTYYLPIDLNIPEICIDFNYGTLKGAGNTITLNNSIFKNIRLYDFTISTSGNDLIIDSVFFDKWLGTALLLNTGTYSHHIKNLYFSQPDDVEDYTGNVGIEYKCTDTVVDGVEGHGFKTAIIVNGANNGLKNSQLWIRRHSNFSGSIFMQLNATNFFLSDTIIDTWENVFVGLYTYLFCQLKNVSYIHNTEMCDNENVTVFTNCSLFSGDILLKLTNFEASGCTCSIGSFSHVNVQVIDGKLSQPLQMDADDILNALPDSTETTSYNVSEGSFIRVNNGTFFANLTISVTGTSPAGNIDIDVSALSNVESINVRGNALASLKLSDGSISFGWVYYFKSGKKISITLPTNVVGWWGLTINEATPASY